jgi:hypothetical protein
VSANIGERFWALSRGTQLSFIIDYATWRLRQSNRAAGIPHASDKSKRSVLHGFGGANNELVPIRGTRIRMLNKMTEFRFASHTAG